MNAIFTYEGLYKLMKLLLLFVNINLSFLFHRFNQYEKHVSELNGHLQVALFFLFNIATITIWNSFKINAFEPQSIKELRFLNISVERNSLEYFFSFVIGYMVLTFIVKAICVDMLGRHISGYKVYKAVLCSSATFWTVMAYESIVISLVQGVSQNHAYNSFNDFREQFSTFILLGIIELKYLYWLVGVYCSVSYKLRIKKTLITILVLIVFGLTELLRFAYTDWVVESNVRGARQDVYLASSAQRRYMKFKDDKDNQLQKGYCLADLNRYTDTLRNNNIFSATMRLKYKMLYILTVAIKEFPNDKELLQMLEEVIKDNLESPYTHVTKMQNRFSKAHFDYIALYEAKRALAEINALPELKVLYEKEIRRETDYDIKQVLYTDYLVSTEYIPDAANMKNKLFFVNRFIRYIP